MENFALISKMVMGDAKRKKIVTVIGLEMIGRDSETGAVMEKYAAISAKKLIHVSQVSGSKFIVCTNWFKVEPI